MEILILGCLILLNGVFAMSEIALVTARRTRLASLAADGDRAAAAAVKLRDEPTRFLSTIQIGITSVGILSGIVGEAAIAEPLSSWLQSLGFDWETSRIGATALVVVLITYFTIVVGELVPKRLGQFNPEGIARSVARPMQMLALVTRPFVRLLSVSTDSLLFLLGKGREKGVPITEDEIRAMLEEGSEAGVIEPHETEMVRNVFRLDERQVGSLMVPRAEITYIDLTHPPAENTARITESRHSHFPVCRGGLDNVVGILSAKQLLNRVLKQAPGDLFAAPTGASFIPETFTATELLAHFRASATTMTLVTDEYGEVQGLVTVQDVIDALTGQFLPHDVEDVWAVEREDGSLLLDGLMPIPELKDTLHLRTLPDAGAARYHTLGGLVIWLLGRLPATGDYVFWEDWRLEVVDLDGKRIDKVLASRPSDSGERTA